MQTVSIVYSFMSEDKQITPVPRPSTLRWEIRVRDNLNYGWWKWLPFLTRFVAVGDINHFFKDQFYRETLQN